MYHKGLSQILTENNKNQSLEKMLPIMEAFFNNLFNIKKPTSLDFCLKTVKKSVVKINTIENEI